MVDGFLVSCSSFHFIISSKSLGNRETIAEYYHCHCQNCFFEISVYIRWISLSQSILNFVLIFCHYIRELLPFSTSSYHFLICLLFSSRFWLGETLFQWPYHLSRPVDINYSLLVGLFDSHFTQLPHHYLMFKSYFHN